MEMLVDDAAMEITIPWEEVLGVLGKQAAKKPIGLVASPIR